MSAVYLYDDACARTFEPFALTRPPGEIASRLRGIAGGLFVAHAIIFDADLLRRLTGYAPQTAVKDGIAEFVSWYRNYYEV